MLTTALLALLLTHCSVAQQIILQQPHSANPTALPASPLPWGQLNILHTTDTHGWLLGHQHSEPSFSGDWGDLYSFFIRAKEEAKRRGVDLLLVDSGDRHDGNGLVDAEPEGRVKGSTASEIFAEMPYDVITTGNHELYQYSVTLQTYTHLAAHYGEAYITSNVNITLPGPSAKSVPLGNRYRKLTTEQGRRITVLAPLFMFNAHAQGTTVQSPREMVKEQWFQEVVRDDPDVFLLAGHMSIRGQSDSQWIDVFNAIRAVHPLTPILIFGGHHHIRDCRQEDARSMSLASGRYMETVGFMSVSGLDDDPTQPLKFSRRYLDQNRNTYKYHMGDNFDTPKGLSITASLSAVAQSFNLTTLYGTAPKSYYLARYPITAEQSVIRLMKEEVLPLLIKNSQRSLRHLTILNTGSVRFDIFKGPFTRNDQWIILPFGEAHSFALHSLLTNLRSLPDLSANNFSYVPSVPRSIALALLPYLNSVGEHGYTPALSATHAAQSDSNEIERIYQASLCASYLDSLDSPDAWLLDNLTWGYVTHDECPGLGDDVLHRPLPASPPPTFISTELMDPSLKLDEREEGEDEEVDVVFLDFITIDILRALNVLQQKRVYGVPDVGVYVEGGLTANTLMQEFARRRWN